MLKRSSLAVLFCISIGIQAAQQRKIGSREGLLASFSYAYIYNLNDQTINPGNAILFDSNGPMSLSITHTTGTSDIVINNDGVYLINFLTQGLFASSFVLFVNNVAVPGGSYESIPDVADKLGKEYGQLIINAKAGDVITLRNYSPANGQGPAYLKAAGKLGKPLSVNASIVILQIG